MTNEPNFEKSMGGWKNRTLPLSHQSFINVNANQHRTLIADWISITAVVRHPQPAPRFAPAGALAGAGVMRHGPDRPSPRRPATRRFSRRSRPEYRSGHTECASHQLERISGRPRHAATASSFASSPRASRPIADRSGTRRLREPDFRLLDNIPLTHLAFAISLVPAMSAHAVKVLSKPPGKEGGGLPGFLCSAGDSFRIP